MAAELAFTMMLIAESVSRLPLLPPRVAVRPRPGSLERSQHRGHVRRGAAAREGERRAEAVDGQVERLGVEAAADAV